MEDLLRKQLLEKDRENDKVCPLVTVMMSMRFTYKSRIAPDTDTRVTGAAHATATR